MASQTYCRFSLKVVAAHAAFKITPREISMSSADSETGRPVGTLMPFRHEPVFIFPVAFNAKLRKLMACGAEPFPAFGIDRMEEAVI